MGLCTSKSGDSPHSGGDTASSGNPFKSGGSNNTDGQKPLYPGGGGGGGGGVGGGQDDDIHFHTNNNSGSDTDKLKNRGGGGGGGAAANYGNYSSNNNNNNNNNNTSGTDGGKSTPPGTKGSSNDSNNNSPSFAAKGFGTSQTDSSRGPSPLHNASNHRSGGGSPTTPGKHANLSTTSYNNNNNNNNSSTNSNNNNNSSTRSQNKAAGLPPLSSSKSSSPSKSAKPPAASAAAGSPHGRKPPNLPLAPTFNTTNGSSSNNTTATGGGRYQPPFTQAVFTANLAGGVGGVGGRTNSNRGLGASTAESSLSNISDDTPSSTLGSMRGEMSGPFGGPAGAGGRSGSVLGAAGGHGVGGAPLYGADGTASSGWRGPRPRSTSAGPNRGIGTSYLPMFDRGEDLEQQRQQVPLSIEEDLFIYDDIVISKDEARTKHWRLAGRKAAFTDSAGNNANASGESGGGGGDGNSDSAAGGGGSGVSPGRTRRSSSNASKSFFSFNDFDVCVDEMDLAPSSTPSAAAAEALQKDMLNTTAGGTSATAASVVAESCTSLGSMSVTNTVPLVRNTVAAYEQKQKENAPSSRRVLRDFSCVSTIGHATRVKCIAVSPLEKDFASCSNEDASVLLTNLALKEEVGIFTGHQDTVINATFSPDGKYLATTSKDKTMILWDVMTTKQLLTFTHAKVVICCCFGPDSKYLVSGCQDRVCRLWDTRRGKEWLSFNQHDGIIIAVAYAPDGSHVCSASADKTLRVWSTTTAKARFTLTGHTGIILSCSYTADGKHIVSNDENFLKVWSTETGACTLSLSPGDVAGGGAQARLGPKGPKLGWTLSCAAPGAFTTYVLVACNNRFVYVIDHETGEEVTNTFCKAPVYCLTAGMNHLAACGDSFGNIYVLKME